MQQMCVSCHHISNDSCSNVISEPGEPVRVLSSHTKSAQPPGSDVELTPHPSRIAKNHFPASKESHIEHILKGGGRQRD